MVALPATLHTYPPSTMESVHSREFDQFFDFELASGSNGFDLEPFREEEDLFVERHGQCFPNTTISGSYSDCSGKVVTCTAPPPPPADGFDSMVFADMNDSPINVPSFWRPNAPCDYCASRQLDCFFLIENQNACNSCTSLFRACSFSNPAARAPRGYLDTLSSVAEDAPQDWGTLTSTKPLFSLGASMNDILDDIMKSKPERTTTRFPRSTTLVLRKWLEAHCDHPYPTEEEKEELKEQTGLTRNQISNWLANARRRGKVRPRRCMSPSANSGSKPIDIPSSPSSRGHSQSHMTPFERWKESPPEHEPASISAITQAARNSQYASGQSGSTSQSQSVADQHRSSTSGGSALRAPSISSLETGRSGRSSGSLASTNGSSHSYGSRSSYTSYGGRDRRRRRRTVPKTQRHSAAPPEQKIFQCTFCTDTFHIKYDWTRHEKSLHLSLEKWRCAPLGPIVASSADGTTQCVYCQIPNPTKDHCESHNHTECEEKGPAARTFFRKDHLRQHLRLIHNVPLSPNMEAWKSAPEIVRSRCGFCPESNPTTFTTWQDRADHLAKHFREGARMIQWKGDWGFDPEVAAQVTNAMPPWMIGEEANTPDPFTASSVSRPPRQNIDVQRDNIQPNEFTLGRATQGKISTCWEVLTVLLGQFTKARLEAGEEITDQMLQRQARILLYDDDDEWNQTAADNVEWLRLFKQAHGIGDGQQLRRTSTTGGASIGKRDSVGSGILSPPDGGFTVDSGGGGIASGIPGSSAQHDDVDEQFRQVFEDAGIFGMDLGGVSAPQQQQQHQQHFHSQLSASAPASSEPIYLGNALWSMPGTIPQPEEQFDFDFDGTDFLNQSG